MADMGQQRISTCGRYGAAKIRSFGAAVVSVLAYGSEAWLLDGVLMASLRGWCVKCMVRLTVRGHRDECVEPSFPVVDKIRSDKLKCLEFVLRSDESNLVRQAVVVMVEDCLAGRRSAGRTVIKDASKHTTLSVLVEIARDRSSWGSLVSEICPRIRKDKKDNKADIDITIGCKDMINY